MCVNSENCWYRVERDLHIQGAGVDSVSLRGKNVARNVLWQDKVSSGEPGAWEDLEHDD